MSFSRVLDLFLLANYIYQPIMEAVTANGTSAVNASNVANAVFEDSVWTGDVIVSIFAGHNAQSLADYFVHRSTTSMPTSIIVSPDCFDSYVNGR